MEARKDRRLDYAEVGPRNRLTIPKVIASKLHLDKGDIVGFYDHPDGILIKKLRLTEDSGRSGP